MDRQCKGCDYSGPVDSFPLSCRRGDKVYRKHYCQGCVNEGQNRRNRAGYLLKRKYGITLEEYQEILAQQGGECRICNVTLEEGRANSARRACVDHCHTEGHVRGILCHRCNSALGLFDDNIGTLLQAAMYLEEDRSNG